MEKPGSNSIRSLFYRLKTNGEYRRKFQLTSAVCCSYVVLVRIISLSLALSLSLSLCVCVFIAYNFKSVRVCGTHVVKVYNQSL